MWLLCPFSWGHLRFSAACHAAWCPSRVPHLADSGWLPYSCGGRLAWGSGCLGTDVLIPNLVSTLCRRNSPFRFFPPLGFCTLDRCVSVSVSSLLVYSWGGVGGVFATSLGFLPCTMLFLRACGLRSLPSCWLPWGFSGHRVSVLQLPWWRELGFSPSLLFLGFSCSACLLG